MKKAMRVGATVIAVMAVGAVLLGTWFYTTIPAPPSPPPDLAADVRARSHVELPAVRAELLRIYWVDQAVRKQVQEAIRGGGTEGIAQGLRLLRISYLESRVDEDNTARLKELVAEHGWLHKGRVGKEGADAAFVIAQHADHDVSFQKTVLKHLQGAYDQGSVTGQQVALLTDRIRVAEGKPQLYGTQAQFRNGRVQFHPIRDSADVDQRRAKMGLPPLSEYAEKLKEQVRR